MPTDLYQMFLRTLWPDIKDCNLRLNIGLYLNSKFYYGEYIRKKPKGFKVIVVSSNNVNYRSPDLFYYTKSDNKSIVVGLGTELSKYNCNEVNGTELKKLTCFKVGDSYISYHGDNVESPTLMKCK